MTMLLTQIFFCLLIAAAIGAATVWLLCRNVALRREEIFQQDWKNRVRQIEGDRDRTIQRQSAEIDKMKKMASQSGQGVALADYENLVAKLEGQVGEREVAISQLREEIQALRAELTEARTSARHRETDLLQQHDRETANLMAQLDLREDPASGERERVLREQHQQDLDRLRAQLDQRDDLVSAEREQALRDQHQQDLDRLGAQLDQRDDLVLAEREKALRQEQEISRLKAELAEQGKPDSGADSGRVAELLAEIELRDDSIAVLRDDIAQLNRDHAIGQRGRQDDELRAAMDEALAWQEKYEAAAAELSRQNKQGARAETAPAPDSRVDLHPVAEMLTTKRERIVSDRIGSVLSNPGGPRDRLQEIRGIGPALERRLNDIGIYHFKQIAEFDADDIVRVSNELGSFANRMKRDQWVAQAQQLHKKYHGQTG